MKTWRRHLRRKRILTALGLCGVVACVLPRSFKQVREPREGEVLARRLCIVYSQRYQISLAGVEKFHPFDINKYAKIYLALVTDGLIRPQDVFVPEEISDADLLRVHTADYLQGLKTPSNLAQYLEFAPAAWVPAALTDAAILRPFREATGGTLLASRLAMEHGMAVNIGGGYHHAEPNRGGGFCVYADMPIAIRTLQAEGAIKRALVVDLDVHQGNGTAVSVAADDSVYTFDMHEAGIYPHPKEKNDLDVPLSAGLGDDEYLSLLAAHLPDVFEQARPDIVFLQAGVDTLAGDPLAHLCMTPEGIVARDRMVFEEAARRRVPIVMVLGGGYSKEAWRAQYRSIRGLIERYGLEGSTLRANPRLPTATEKLYTR